MQTLSSRTVDLPMDFVRDLAEAESVAGVLDVIATWLPEIVDGERASVTLATEDGEDGEDGENLEVARIVGNRAIPVGALVPIAGTLLGRVHRERRTINVEEFAPEDGVDAAMLHDGGLRCSLDAPLLSGGRCLGTLGVAHSRPRWFDDHAAATMEVIARLVATSILAHREVEIMPALATTDPLTGVSDRRTFDRCIAASWRGFRRRGESFALAIVELDDFSAVDDRLGRDAGDTVLRAAAEAVRSCVRGGDVVARVGGEQFAVLLPGMPAGQIRPWAERLRATIAAGSVRVGGEDVSYTTSVGVAVVGGADTDVSDVYRRADRALYTAKVEGRDRVVAAAL